MLGLGLGLVYWHRWLSMWLSYRLRGRFSPLVIRAALRGARPLPSPHPRRSLAGWLLRHYLQPEHQAYSYHLILAADTGGKTTFLLRLFARFQWPGSPWRRVLMLPAADADAMARLADWPQPEQTLLLLDGLDEDPLLHLSGRVRVDEWLEATAAFKQVVMSCTPNHWPGSLAPVAEREAIRYTGERVVQLMACFRLPAPVQQPKARRWLRRLYGLAEPHPDRPPFRVQRVEDILTQLGPSPPQRPALAKTFWRAVALEMAERAQQGFGLTLPAPKLHDLHLLHAPNWALKALTRDLLWRDGQGLYQFHHAALAAYFLAQAEEQPPHPQKEMPWAGLPQAKVYRQEMAWLACLAHPDHAQVAFRLPDEVQRHPLSALEAPMVSRISRLYLPMSLIGEAERLLPGLPDLRGLYLYGDQDQALPGGWLEALPHHEVMVYYLDQAAKLESVWQYQPTETVGYGSPQLRDGTLSFEPLKLRAAPAIEAPLPHPQGGSLDDRRLSEWLAAELAPWLKATMPVEEVAPETWRLTQAAFGLFHRLQIWPGVPGRINLQLDLAFPSTLLTEELRPLVAELVARMGEDDQHLRQLTPDDEAQLEDGFWTGRRWLWGNTDRYAAPVRLTSEQAGFATLEIWNLRLSPRAE